MFVPVCSKYASLIAIYFRPDESRKLQFDIFSGWTILQSHSTAGRNGSGRTSRRRSSGSTRNPFLPLEPGARVGIQNLCFLKYPEDVCSWCPCGHPALAYSQARKNATAICIKARNCEVRRNLFDVRDEQDRDDLLFGEFDPHLRTVIPLQGDHVAALKESGPVDLPHIAHCLP
jgi:hypothetical protein